MNWKKKFMWAASFLVSLFVCGTALAAGNDASADTSAQGKEENQVYRFGIENNANDITETEASAAESGAAGFENKEMYLYEGEWVGDGEDWQYRLTDGSFLKASWLKSNGHWYYLGKSSYMHVFIDTYMAGASGEYVKVYLYLLRHQQEEVSIGQIADALNHTEADVQRALAYWQRAGVLGTEVGEEAQRSFPETPGQQISPVFASTESLAGAGSFAPSAKTAAREAAACDMSRLTSDESFKQLIYIAQQYLNKLLTPTDCQILGNLYSNLGFSGELLEYLIEYCVQNHHTSLRYMEKVALGWHKRGIKDVEQAKASGRGYTKGSFAVMRAMGLSDRSPAEVESEFIEKWFWEYGFTRELIVEACSRTIRQIHKPSFDYADKILRDWKNAGVKSFRDVSELDKKRKEEGEAKRRQASAGSSRSSNRFHNLEEHGYDYDEMVWSMINGAQKTGGDDGTQ